MPIISHTYRAAIFDLDGTLIDSLEDLADSANAMLKSYGFPTHPVDPYRYFVGNGSRKLIERCLPKEQGSDPAFVDEALARYKDIYAYAGQDPRLRRHPGHARGAPETPHPPRHLHEQTPVCRRRHRQRHVPRGHF